MVLYYAFETCWTTIDWLRWWWYLLYYCWAWFEPKSVYVNLKCWLINGWQGRITWRKRICCGFFNAYLRNNTATCKEGTTRESSCCPQRPCLLRRPTGNVRINKYWTRRRPLRRRRTQGSAMPCVRAFPFPAGIVGILRKSTFCVIWSQDLPSQWWPFRSRWVTQLSQGCPPCLACTTRSLAFCRTFCLGRAPFL